MNEAAKKRLVAMPREQQQLRFRQLREKLQLGHPQLLTDDRALSETSSEDHDEYQFLAEFLGYRRRP
jgi:hypothetical protein